MTAAQYREALGRLGLTQGEAAALLNVTIRTSGNYARYGCGGPAEAFLRYLLHQQANSMEFSRDC